MNGLSRATARRIWLFVVLAALVSAVAGVGLATISAGKTTGTWPLWTAAVATYVVTAWPIHVTTSSGRHSISLVEVVLVLGMFTHDPMTFLLGTIAGVIPAFVRLRQPPLKFAVNLSQSVLWTVVPLLVFHAATDQVIVAQGRVFLVSLATAALAVVGSAATIKIPIGFASGRWRPEAGELRRVGAASATALGGACIGLIGVVLAARDPRLLTLLLLPVMQIVVSSIQQARDAERSRLFDFTVGATERLRVELDTPSVLVDLLDEIRSAFGVKHATLLISSRGETLRVEANEGGSANVVGVEGEAELRSWLVGHALDGPALLADTPALASLGEALGTDDLVVAPLSSHHGDGALVLHDGLSSTLRRDHGEFLRTLCTNASAALEHHALSLELDAAAQREVELERRASHDGLTGLANRSLFEREVTAALASEAEVTVLYIDLNDFKEVNDVHGHASGDAVLVATAERMRSVLRPGDVPARLGGDEFAVLVRREGREVGESIGNRILEAFRAPVEGVPAIQGIAAAIGSSSSRPEDSIESLLHRADAAMYAAKRGRATEVVAG